MLGSNSGLSVGRWRVVTNDDAQRLLAVCSELVMSDLALRVSFSFQLCDEWLFRRRCPLPLLIAICLLEL